jgi:hypothetical protein
MKKIALEEHFTTPVLSAYAHGPGSSMNRQGFGQFEPRLLEFGDLRGVGLATTGSKQRG